MKIKLLVSRCGNGWTQAYGETVEVEEAEGGRMIAAGQAEAVGGVQDPEPEADPELDPAPVKKTKKRGAK